MRRRHGAPARGALVPTVGEALAGGAARGAAAGTLGEGRQRRLAVEGLDVGAVRPRLGRLTKDLGVVEGQPRRLPPPPGRVGVVLPVVEAAGHGVGRL